MAGLDQRTNQSYICYVKNPMDTTLYLLLDAIDKDDLETATCLVTRVVNLKVPCSELDGAPALFFAILKGNLPMVQLLLDHGADPNYRAEEPVATIYAENPLSLAKGARFLLNWDQYQPIAQLLEKFGAVDEGAPTESQQVLEKIEAKAKRWQSRSRK